MKSVYNEDQLAMMPKEKANRLRYKVQGLPDKNSKTRMLSPEEIFELLQDPRARAAVDLMEKVEGHEKAVRGVVRAACSNIRRDDMHAKEQRKLIDLQIAKNKG